jgi:hypothetical protein
MNFSHLKRAVLEALAYPYPGKSTKYHFSSIKKWLINCVFPGVPEVFARFFFPVNILINEDLPTFERPIKANSNFSSVGHLVISELETTNTASLIFIITAKIIGLKDICGL